MTREYYLDKQYASVSRHSYKRVISKLMKFKRKQWPSCQNYSSIINSYGAWISISCHIWFMPADHATFMCSIANSFYTEYFYTKQTSHSNHPHLWNKGSFSQH